MTHNYTGYPMVRQARDMVKAGELGAIRVVQVEYPQDWLADPPRGHRPEAGRLAHRPGALGRRRSVGDIGTHAFNLAEFVAGRRSTRVAADLHTFVQGRRLDDNAHMLLRFDRGAQGMLWCSQVACGHDNGLRIRIYGEKAGLEWVQEQPNHMLHTPLGKAPRLLRRNSAGADAVSRAASRIPAGHPEGYLEGFAQLYTDIAEQIVARIEGREPDPLSLQVPTVDQGVRGVRFIEAALRSSQRKAAWTAV